MVACLIFVFGALIEYSVVNVLARRKKEYVQKQMRRNMDIPPESASWMNMLGPGPSTAMIQSNKVNIKFVETGLDFILKSLLANIQVYLRLPYCICLYCNTVVLSTHAHGPLLVGGVRCSRLWSTSQLLRPSGQ